MKIHTRIVYGHAIVLSLAFLGTAVGLTIGNHYQRRAFEHRKIATAERKLLTDLQVGILYNRPAKQLSPYLEDPARFQKESQALLDRIAALQVMLREHEALHGAEPHQDHQDELHSLLDEYEGVVDQLYKRTQLFIQEVGGVVGTSQGTELANQRLLAFVQSPEFLTFIEFPDQLERYIDGVEKQEQAAEVSLQNAEVLRIKIILGSLLISAAIATGLALYTSQAIARPIQVVTDVARQVTEDNNFDLQVATDGRGEAGILAQSLNQLIHKVKQLLAQLQQKNTDLEAALAQVSHQQMQLVQAEKMSSLGQLVAGVAHEINNPVNFIHGNLPYVQEHTQNLLHVIALYQKQDFVTTAELQAVENEIDLDFIQDDLPKILNSIELGTHRIRQIVLSLRNFSRMDEDGFKAVDIHEGINSTLMILQHRLKDKVNRPAIQVCKDYGTLPLVDCQAGQLNQVFMNILSNAIDAIDEHNHTLSKSEQREHSNQITIRTTLLTENWVEIAIADNGLGIPEEIQNRIFEPFFTTKPVGQGTGIGMALSYQIITEKHGGKLKCFSIPKKGAEFIIQLPVNQSHSAAA